MRGFLLVIERQTSDIEEVFSQTDGARVEQRRHAATATQIYLAKGHLKKRCHDVSRFLTQRGQKYS
jgi:hypothetical protein